MKEGSMAIAINVKRFCARPQRRRRQFFSLNKTCFSSIFHRFHSYAYWVFSTHKHKHVCVWAGLFMVTRRTGAPDIKVRASRALIDLNGPDQPHPRPPPSPWPSSTLRLQALPELCQVTVVPSPSTAVPLLSRRPHWLGLWAANWLPGLTWDLLCQSRLARSSTAVSDPDYGHQTWSSSWPWPGNWFSSLTLDLSHHHRPVRWAGLLVEPGCHPPACPAPQLVCTNLFPFHFSTSSWSPI